MKLPSITLIISTYNNPKALDEIFRRLEDGTELPEQVLISDDGSRAETKVLIEKWQATSTLNIQHCWHEDNGFRKNRILNVCLSEVTEDYVVFLDGDCLPMSRFVADHRRLAEAQYFVQGRRAFIAESEVAAVLSRETNMGSLFLRGKLSGLAKAFRFPVPVIKRNKGHRGLIGCNLAIWTKDLVAINGFDESYEGWGIGEDSDLCIRLYNMGRQRKFVYGRAIVFHLDHPVLNKDHVPESLQKLQQTIDCKTVRCEQGLNLHVKEGGRS